MRQFRLRSGISRLVASVLLSSVLAACGGGGGGSGSSPNPPPLPPAPSALVYPTPPAFSVNAAIVTLTPTVNGTVTSYAVAPALPAGLSLNAGTGAISGTPTVVQSTTNYQVTATNAGGSTAATVTIAVNDIPPEISYAPAAHTLTTGVPATLTPARTGGAVVTWTISPTPPAGISFSATTGVISGAPTAVQPSRRFVVTAQNSGGSDTFDLDIAVQSGELLDLIHGGSIRKIVRNATHMMSADDSGRGNLFRLDTGAVLARTNDCVFSCVALAGPTAVFQSADRFAIHSTADGARTGEIAVPANSLSWWVLATNGSYLCGGTPTGVTCWSSLGTLLFTRAGDYRNGLASAEPGLLRIGRGAAGNQVIEKLAVPSGASTLTAAFSAEFHSWFREGARFLGRSGNTVVVYSNEGVQQDIAAVPTVEDLGADGNWFWTASATSLRIYRVGASASPAATYPMPSLAYLRASSSALAILSPVSLQFSIVDLSGATPVKQDLTSKVLNLGDLGSFGASDGTHWSLGARGGCMFGERNGLSELWSRGTVRSMSATPTRIAISMACGTFVVFDAQTRQLENELDSTAQKVELSSDGTRLAAGPGAQSFDISPDRSLTVYQLPAFSIVNHWTYSDTGPAIAVDFTFSDSGGVIGRDLILNGTREQRVTLVDDTPVFSQPSTAQPIRLSPDGTRIAISSGGPSENTGTNVYVNGALTSAASGWTPGWLDDARLLVNRYERVRFADVYAGSVVVDTAGNTVATPPLPELRQFQRVSANLIYSPALNVILNAATGETVWSSATESRGPGAVSGAFVVFLARDAVRIEPR